MKLAIMQPYFFPYIGYFQLIKAVDIFVFYDDVNFIKKGWINRNKILVNNKEYLFTIPLNKISQNNTIKETDINLETFKSWKENFYKTLEYNYRKAPYYDNVIELIKTILNKDCISISELAILCVVQVSKFLSLNTKFVIASERYDNRGLQRQNRLIDICKKEDATQYINALGGQELYDKNSFKEEGIELSFIKSLPIYYQQFNSEFIPWLSIIDLLMFNSAEEVNEMLNKFELL